MYEISRFNHFGKNPVAFLTLASSEITTSHGIFYVPQDVILLDDLYEFTSLKTGIWLRTHDNKRAYIWGIKKTGIKLYLADDFRPFLYKFIAEEQWWKTLSWVKENEL